MGFKRAILRLGVLFSCLVAVVFGCALPAMAATYQESSGYYPEPSPYYSIVPLAQVEEEILTKPQEISKVTFESPRAWVVKVFRADHFVLEAAVPNPDDKVRLQNEALERHISVIDRQVQQAHVDRICALWVSGIAGTLFLIPVICLIRNRKNRSANKPDES